MLPPEFNEHRAAVVAGLLRAIRARGGRPALFAEVLEQVRCHGGLVGRRPLLVELILEDLAVDPSTPVTTTVGGPLGDPQVAYGIGRR